MDAEVVRSLRPRGISPVGWGTVGGGTDVHYWEYNSTNVSDGSPWT
jgi:hypothetical protein